MNRDTGNVVEWLEVLRKRSDLSVGAVSLNECRDWLMDDVSLRHVTGRYFSVVGIRCVTEVEHLRNFASPMIDQPENGVLGFVVRRRGGIWEWLLQGKTEPGSISGTQIGPSVQATRSNYLCVHGGRATPMIDCFLTPPSGVRTLVDVLQSEQGDSFLGKYNRNAVVEAPDDFAGPDRPNWAWFSAHDLGEALLEDFTINTDARSVLCCADWAMLADSGPAFSRWARRGGFGEALLRTNEQPAEIGDIVSALQCRRASTAIRIERVALHALHGWRVDDRGILPSNGHPSRSVQLFSVSASDREMPNWCQPLLAGTGENRIVLVCSVISGVLRFLLRMSVEPGFRESIQFGPSFVSTAAHSRIDWVTEALADPDAFVHASILQSDEGGRFANSVARYEIVEVPERWGKSRLDDGVWVTLAELRAMTAHQGLLTNEVRSNISLLLAWA